MLIYIINIQYLFLFHIYFNHNNIYSNIDYKKITWNQKKINLKNYRVMKKKTKNECFKLKIILGYKYIIINYIIYNL